MADDSDLSSQGMINDFFSKLGLPGLGDWAWTLKVGNPSITMNEVLYQARQRPEWKVRFPAMDTLAKMGKAIDEGTYIAYERNLDEHLHLYGIPGGMYNTPQGVADLLIKGVSTNEVNERLNTAANAAFTTSQATRDSLAENYGVDFGSLTAYFLDPNKALSKIQQQYTSSQIQAASRVAGVGQTIGTAERLSGQVQEQGLTPAQLADRFNTVNQAQAFTAGYGETTTQDANVNAAFGDTQAAALQSRIARSRLASFQGGGGAQATASGVTGLGSAATT